MNGVSDHRNLASAGMAFPEPPLYQEIPFWRVLRRGKTGGKRARSREIMKPWLDIQ